MAKKISGTFFPDTVYTVLCAITLLCACEFCVVYYSVMAARKWLDPVLAITGRQYFTDIIGESSTTVT